MGRKKIAALLMAVALMVSVCAPVFAGGAPPDLVIHDGIKMYEIYRGSLDPPCEGRGWTYDTNMNTLTLNEFDGKYIHMESTNSKKFNLILNGDNSIELSEGLSKEESSPASRGALSGYVDLSISGEGSLTVVGGISAYNMILKSGRVKATGRYFPVKNLNNAEGGSYSYGISEAVWIEENLIVESGLLEAFSDSDVAIRGDVNRHTTKKFTINGGKVWAKSYQAAVDFDSFEMTDGELIIEQGGLICKTFSLAQGLKAIGGFHSNSKDALVHKDGELQYDYSKWNELEEGEEPFQRATYVYIGKENVPDQPINPDDPDEPNVPQQPSRPTQPSYSGGGSSGGSSSSSAVEKPKTYTAVQALKDLKKAEDGKVQLKNIAEIPYTALKALKGKDVVLQADQKEKGKIVFRMTIDPSQASKDVKSIQTGAKLEDKKTQEKFEKYFTNEMRFMKLNQKGSYGMTVKIAAKVDLSGMDTGKLYFYHYDAASNRYRRIEKPNYYVDRNGYLHFETTEGGSVIISEKPLERR